MNKGYTWGAQVCYKPKPWNGTFEIMYIKTPNLYFTLTSSIAWVIVNKHTNERATARWYASEGQARRGAAQIYNKIEKTLLG